MLLMFFLQLRLYARWRRNPALLRKFKKTKVNGLSELVLCLSNMGHVKSLLITGNPLTCKDEGNPKQADESRAAAENKRRDT